MTIHDPSGPDVPRQSYGQQPYGQQPEYFPRPQPSDYRGHYVPQRAQLPPGPPPAGSHRGGPAPKRPHRARNVMLGILGVIALIIIIANAVR